MFVGPNIKKIHKEKTIAKEEENKPWIIEISGLKYHIIDNLTGEKILIDKFSFGFANHFGGFIGQISIEGQFDNNSAYAIFYLPILRFGYRHDDFSVSMSWAASYIFKSVSRVGDLKARGPGMTWNDIFCTIAVEQPFLKNTYLSIGLSLTYSRSPYQSWLLCNTIDEYLFVPEFFFGFQL